MQSQDQRVESHDLRTSCKQLELLFQFHHLQISNPGHFPEFSPGHQMYNQQEFCIQHLGELENLKSFLSNLNIVEKFEITRVNIPKI